MMLILFFCSFYELVFETLDFRCLIRFLMIVVLLDVHFFRMPMITNVWGTTDKCDPGDGVSEPCDMYKYRS